jgi:peptidoglycan/LPS O-acetylase OafA/YrhL
MTNQKKRIRLNEVTLMRTILAVLIVFMHAFTCFQGGWAKSEGYIDILTYKI